ncbi:MAG: GNAT family N-acetyltransferase [Bacteroidota bacterium]
MNQFYRAGISDALAISLLAEFSFRSTFRESFRDHRDLTAYCKKTFNYGKLKSSLAKEENHFIALKVAGELVGYAKLKLADRPIQLQKIYLHPAFIGRGLGKELLQESMEIARAAGGRRLWLAVECGNVAAIAFYLRQGFAEATTFDFQIGSQTFQFLRMEINL